MRLLAVLILALASVPAVAASSAVEAPAVSVQDPWEALATDSAAVVVSFGPGGTAETCPDIPFNVENGHVMYCSDGKWTPVACPLVIQCPSAELVRLVVLRH
jgi:hypothetical protein